MNTDKWQVRHPVSLLPNWVNPKLVSFCPPIVVVEGNKPKRMGTRLFLQFDTVKPEQNDRIFRGHFNMQSR